MLVGLTRNEFNKLFLRKFLNGLLELVMDFDGLRPMSTKPLFKALVKFVEFVISSPFVFKVQ